MTVTILDLGLGNLHSLRKALEACGAQTSVQRPAEVADRPECLVLPGVGSFQAGARALLGHAQRIRSWMEAGTPTLGVCVGMQLFFEGSDEGPGDGLGFLRGRVRILPPTVSPRPHMGWARVRATESPLFGGLADGAYYYFANSYAPVPTDRVVAATTDAGAVLVSAVRQGNAFGVQFHPEKSGRSGLALLKNFLTFAEARA